MYNYLTKNKAIYKKNETKTKKQEEKKKRKKKEDVFAGKSAIYVKHFQTKEI